MRVPVLDLKAQYATLRAEIEPIVLEVCASQVFVLGPQVEALEQEVAAYVRTPHAIGCASGTDAIILALRALGVGPGDEVVTSPFTFFATAGAVSLVGARPVWCDIDPATFDLDPERLEAAMTPRTRAVIAVDLFGQCADMTTILDIATRRGVPVIEDAACAIGSELLWEGQWERVGRPHADIACFSFHPRKLLSTGDGGMLTTRSPKLDATFRLLRQHGMTVPDTVRHASSQVVFEEYAVPAFNYRMTDIQAAIGREQLARLSTIVERRRALAAGYGELLRGTLGVIPAVEPAWARTNWQSYTVRLEPPLDQRRVMQRMLDEGVSTRRGVMNAHREPAYPAGSWRSAGPLVRGEQAQDTVIVLPLYHQMTDEEQQRVASSLKQAVSR